MNLRLSPLRNKKSMTVFKPRRNPSQSWLTCIFSFGWLALGWGWVAHAGTTSIVGGYSIGNGYVSPLTGFTVQAETPKVGGGLLLGFDLVKGGMAQVELGVLYMPRGFLEVSNNKLNTTQVSQTAIQLPLLLRISLVPLVSVGVGGFVSYSLVSTSNLSALDSGLVGSVATRIGFEKAISVLIDVRYQFGMTNLSTRAGVGTYLNELQGLTGIVLAL